MTTTENAAEIPAETISKGPLLGVRHLQVALLFFVITVNYVNRMHVAITIVAMTNANKSNPDFPEYDWNEEQKSYILSSVFWGYILTQIPGAYFSRRYGVKTSALIYTLSTGFFSLLMPICITWGGWKTFCLLRFLQGFSQGGMYPAVFQHLAKWSPPAERGWLIGITHASYECSDLLGMALSGYIATTSLGWPGVFYTYAGFCFVWCVLWQLFGADSITKSSFITSEEKLYIEKSLKDSVNFQTGYLPVPWRAILSSKAFLVLIVVRAVAEGGLVTAKAEWPTYIDGILKLNFEENTLYSSLPYVVTLFSTFVYAFIANAITKRNFMSMTMLRKCFNSFGLWLPAIGLILLGFLNENDKQLAMIAMMLIVVTHNSGNFGNIVCLIEMAPNHTEILTSVANMFSNTFVLIGPLLVGLIVKDEQNQHQWQIAFAVIAVGFCIGDLLFLIWGTAEEQPWNAANFLRNQDNDAQEIDVEKMPKYTRKSSL